jgi:hypothetical protein
MKYPLEKTSTLPCTFGRDELRGLLLRILAAVIPHLGIHPVRAASLDARHEYPPSSAFIFAVAPLDQLTVDFSNSAEPG